MKRFMNKNALLVFSFLIPLGAWFFQLFLSYTLAHYYCEGSSEWLFHLISFIAFILACTGLNAALSVYRDSAERVLASVALIFGVLILLIIIVGDLANFWVKAC